MTRNLKNGLFCFSFGCCALVFLAGLGVSQDDPPYGDASKYGTCEDSEDQDGEKCEGQVGNCLEYTMGEEFTLGACVNFSDVSYTPTLPGGFESQSAKAIEARTYGTCDSANSTDKCKQCGKYWCVKANFYAAEDCPRDETPKVFAVARSNACDPT